MKKKEEVTKLRVAKIQFVLCIKGERWNEKKHGQNEWKVSEQEK